MIGRAERDQTYFRVSRTLGDGLDSPDDLLLCALSQGAINHARLTKTTSLGAAAHDLDHPPVVDRLHVGHNQALGCGRQRVDHALDHGHLCLGHGRDDGLQPAVVGVGDLVEARYIDAGHLGQLPKCVFLVRAPLSCTIEGVNHLQDSLIRLADDKGVDEIDHRLGLVGATSPSDDQRHALVSLGGADGQPSQIQHVEHIGQVQFVGQAEPNEVER